MNKYLLSFALVILFCQYLQAQLQNAKMDLPVVAINGNNIGFSRSLFLKDTAYAPEYYLQKSKNQQTAAWFMLGGGFAMAVIGMVGVNETLFDNAANTYAAVWLSGVGLALGSIPLFIASSHNARKAATLNLKNQPILVPQQNSFIFKAQPAISVNIPL